MLGQAEALLPSHRETAVVAQVLYYGLTTGAGMQALGEEYCDILQVSGKFLPLYTVPSQESSLTSIVLLPLP